MRTALVCLCVLGLTMVAGGQDTAGPGLVGGQDRGALLLTLDTPPAAVLKARQLEVGAAETRAPGEGEPMVVKSRVVAKGDVEIRIGQSLLTADEAEIRYGAPGEPDEVELRGHVLLKAHVTVDRD